ncbi:urate hydroxylase PuuD [Herbaspirillum seropedicae]|uniref:Transmembrane protein n=1 Tax=Herbaspirillum seropedicae (strain SmR1) TaxID=757424 RepID=D8IUJ6_HERSS|nr:urate hydroxylase PuuD [Herbaspirillum seropedicae]ADJ65728.1 transmembrane protein [Herbaspirillum seropedicae SmR1]NQE29576.1 membrane protein [Herbaspirillum seropedicae]UMU23543.1 urate hydroxylase PuuD [Herbaspirillum seropedicae]
MEAYILDWLNLLLRWLHVITAIAWIGSSFYFVWLDNSLVAPTDPELKEKGVGGELWAVHGGGFYNPQKYLLAPKVLPEHLHWFYWESYSTWLSGFALFSLLYLFNANVFLVDRNVFDMSASMAGGAAIAFLIFNWLIYDAICSTIGDRPGADRLVNLLVGLQVVVSVWAACHLFSGRAAFLISGASLATIMSANVLVWIIPGQRKMVASMRAGQAPDPIHGKRGKQRSVHNTYFTLPVLFAMLSNHYSMTYNAPHNWVVLLVIMAAGALIRQFFVLRHKGVYNWWYPGIAVGLLLAVIVWMSPLMQARPVVVAASSSSSSSSSSSEGGAFAQVQQVIQARCIQCHAAQPTLMPVPGKGVLLDSPEHISQHAQQIYQQAVVQKAMPLGNMTHITEEERAVIGKWFEAGAAVK